MFVLQYFWISPASTSCIPQSTMEIKNPYGLDTNCETVYILRFAPDEDGSLKLKHALAFKDSRVYSELHQALAAAKTSN